MARSENISRSEAAGAEQCGYGTRDFAVIGRPDGVCPAPLREPGEIPPAQLEQMIVKVVTELKNRGMV